ncbi:MAG: 3'-5' exoribonuclease [Anaerolineae bacterium]|nr:3'-5' exoribonuclease [Anaerolineae bacterium]
MPTIVALDIETTGLISQTDEIIEIGAVKFNGKRVEEEFSTLIKPKKSIPSAITQLTNITNEMVRNAPAIGDVIQDFADFVGNAPVLGHNIRFDLSFLQRFHILLDNPVLDTYELASVLMPTSSRYNLGSLAQILGIINPIRHRALQDADATRQVYLKLVDKANEMPLEVIAEFVRQSEPFDWDASWVFQQILRNRSHQSVVTPRKTQAHNYGPLFANSNLFGTPLTPVDPPQVIDPDEVCSILEHGGAFSKHFENYEMRPQQLEMVRAVSNALSYGQHLMVEAGTGTGKSFAYLVPAAVWALQNNYRVVISTNTINLQDQLVKKDIPDMSAAMGVDLRYVVLKGRSNYLCPRRFGHFRQHGPDNADQMRVLAKVQVWLMEGGSGDRNEINLNGPIERDIWNFISAEDEGCKVEVCLSRTGGICPFYQAHQAAQSAHIIIVNHALLLADVATGSRILPEYNYLIIDEAHHLEAATTGALSYRVTQNDLTRMLKELGGTSSGILSRLLATLKYMLRPSDFAVFHQHIERSSDLSLRLSHYLNEFFININHFLDEQREGQPLSSYGQQERILPATRTLSQWEGVEISWDSVEETFSLLLNLLTQIYKSIADEIQEENEELEDSQDDLGNLLRRLNEAYSYLGGFVNKPSNDFIYWVELTPNRNQLALQVAPLHIGSLMEKYLWHEKSSVILTSATLATSDGFDYLRNRLNADEADELALGSPFDYETSAMLYLTNDISEPSDTSNYQRAIERSIIQLGKATGGRMLALFTSYAQLKRTSQAISPALAEDGITVYEQGEGASANTLLETFREADRAVLLGTRAFWEGVDIPGNALSVLVITKLPFDVPSDPIIAARSETFDDPFNEYHLPEAILRFRQGFGRLIRSQSDRGIVVILDRRILTKRYGKAFIEALPTCAMKIDSLINLPTIAARWLGM